MYDTPFGSASPLYRAAGWTGGIPVTAKSPAMRGVSGYRGIDLQGDALALAQRVMAGHNIGLRLPEGVVGIDIDCYTTDKGVVKDGPATLASIMAGHDPITNGHQVAPMPATWSTTSRGPGQPSRILLFRATLPAGRRWRNRPGVDIIHRGHRNAVVWPSRHPTRGDVYRWYDPRGQQAAEGVIPGPEHLAELPATWVWALSQDGTPVGLYGGPGVDTTEYVAQGRDANGIPCASMQRAQEAAVGNLAAGNRHNAMRDGQLTILDRAATGHGGVMLALSGLYSAFMESTGGDNDRQREWYRSLQGAAEIVSAKYPEAEQGLCVCVTGQIVQDAVFAALAVAAQERAAQEAVAQQVVQQQAPAAGQQMAGLTLHPTLVPMQAPPVPARVLEGGLAAGHGGIAPLTPGCPVPGGPIPPAAMSAWDAAGAGAAYPAAGQQIAGLPPLPAAAMLPAGPAPGALLAGGMPAPGHPSYGDRPALEDLRAAVRARLQPMTLDELLALPAQRAMVQGWLYEDAVHYLVGPSGTWKSFLAMDMALHVATGQEWMGRKVGPPKRILYVATEGHGDMQRRAHAWLQRNGHIDLYKQNVQIIAKVVSAKDDGAWNDLKLLTYLDGIELVVLDTQAKVAGGYEENSNSDMSQFIGRLEGLRRVYQEMDSRDTRTCAVIVVHHSGHEAGRGRGASAIYAGIDIEWQVEAFGDRENRQANVRMTKNKYGADGQLIGADLELEWLVDDTGRPVLDEYGVELASLVPVYDPERKLVRKARPIPAEDTPELKAQEARETLVNAEAIVEAHFKGIAVDQAATAKEIVDEYGYRAGDSEATKRRKQAEGKRFSDKYLRRTLAKMAEDGRIERDGGTYHNPLYRLVTAAPTLPGQSPAAPAPDLRPDVVPDDAGQAGSEALSEVSGVDDAASEGPAPEPFEPAGES